MLVAEMLLFSPRVILVGLVREERQCQLLYECVMHEALESMS